MFNMARSVKGFVRACKNNDFNVNCCSPVSDILDKEEFTLQELLEEDELLQEVKAMNNKLID